MTLEEAEQFLFFMRDEMLKNPANTAELVWKMPNIALNDPVLARLVYRWYNATKVETRKYIEGRVISHVASVNQ